MEWARIVAYITGTVDQELLLRNEYRAAENRILRGQLKGRLRFSDAERATLGEIGRRLGRKALGEVANAALPDTKTVEIEQASVRLTVKEYELLELLCWQQSRPRRSRIDPILRSWPCHF